MVINKRSNVSIKGTKEGLVFILKEDCSFDEIISELKNNLEDSCQNFFDGPTTKVKIKTGYRLLDKKQKEILEEIFRVRNNLFVYSIESDLEIIEQKIKDQVIVKTGTIRSGQVYEVDGSILFIGDINPGGSIISTNSIYVIGSLKGIAHAGSTGDNNSVIVASEMDPIQLRINGVVRNKFEKNFKEKNISLYAYLRDGRIVLKKYNNILG
ncbi:MAG: septum site-determining protein MinC [Vulcanibacillus sp.]